LAVSGSYLLLEKEGLWCVDLNAALSRILFEQFEKKAPALQTLLQPLQMQGDAEDVETLTELGIECRLIGQNTMAIDAVPSDMSACSFEKFVFFLKQERKMDRAVCFASRLGKKTFTLEEACHIWQQLKKCSDSLYDPLGKKIWVPMDLKVWFSHQE
jgi:DNA mismatch repair ATPase MutL